VAGSPGCPPHVLGQLSKDPVPAVRLKVAGNPSCPASTLEHLLRSKAVMVAETAASNPSLPAAVAAMWQLAHDAH